MNKAIKYRIYPTSEQKKKFIQTFGCCRLVWNLMLADKIKHYQEHKESLQTTPAQYKSKFPFLRDVDSLALANVQLQLQAAYRKFFKEPKIGFPKFKSKKRSHHSYTTNNQNGTVSLAEKGIRLPKIGIVKTKLHRLPMEGWKLKSATISMEKDGKFYCAVLFEYDAETPAITINVENSIGLDYKSDGFYVDSNGDICGSPKYFRNSQKKLAKAQRRLSRKIGSKKGETKSANYIKQQQKVAKIQRHVANQRKDFAHKKSAEIANRYDLVSVESIDYKSISNKGFGNGKATLDNGFGMFRDMLSYKLAERGKAFIKVDKYFPSSQLCSDCGYQDPLLKDLSVREWVCPVCGCHHDRDENAARNIRDEGIRIFLASIIG